MVIVGAGISGLTAGAYLVRSGHDVLILEKSSRCGGLVSSFQKEGFRPRHRPEGLRERGDSRSHAGRPAISGFPW